MRRTPLPDQEKLRALIDYNPETGDAFWKTRTPADFESGSYSAERRCASFNGAYAGKPTFTCKNNGLNPILQGQLFGRHYVAHRLIWKMVYGDEPEEVVAINGDLTDLRIENLRASTKLYTAKNETMFRHNTSGFRGVCWDASRNRWKAYIKANGRHYELGRFAKVDEAIAARRRAEQKHGFDLGPVEKPADAA